MSKNKQSGNRLSASEDLPNQRNQTSQLYLVQVTQLNPASTQIEPPIQKKTLRKDDVEKMVEDLFCMETYLQWLQVQRQQCLNLEFSRPLPFSKGELAALNRAIVKLEQIIQRRNEDLASFFPFDQGE